MLSQIRIAISSAALLLAAAPLQAAGAPATFEVSAPTLSVAGHTGFSPLTRQISHSALSLVHEQALSQNPQSKLASSIAAASTPDIVQRGTAISKQAVLDCLKGDYPGGGMGSLSMPFGRPNALTDHCRQ